MLGDPILHLVFKLLGILAAAFAVGALLFQFRFRAIWCLITGEAAILLAHFGSTRYPYDDDWLGVMHLFVLPVLLALLFGGYYFNKYILHIPE
jgi:hypothetical protein